MISKSKKSISLILDDDFTQYCELNNIEDQKSFAKRIFNQGFSIIKYGETPNGVQGKEKIVEKEVIKEIPVEKIVEVIKEVPVKTKDKIQVVTKEVIKEVFVDKIIPDVEKDNTIQRLTEENQKLTNELNKITTALDRMGKAKYLKNSDLSDLYDE
jgi:hypothetical protein